jgi:hypothetical protein
MSALYVAQHARQNSASPPRLESKAAGAAALVGNLAR